jgi:hypothetical protein
MVVDDESEHDTWHFEVERIQMISTWHFDMERLWMISTWPLEALLCNPPPTTCSIFQKCPPSRDDITFVLGFYL